VLIVIAVNAGIWIAVELINATVQYVVKFINEKFGGPND